MSAAAPSNPVGSAVARPFARFAVIVALTGLYLCLPVLGWGGLGPLLAHPARAAALLGTLLMAVLSFFSGGNISAGVREDRANRWVLWAFGTLGLLNGYLPAFGDRHGLWTIGGDAVRWLGVAAYAAGGALRLWPVFVLGDRFSGLVAIQPGHTLVTRGIYGAIRNPSYLGLLVASAGWALVFRSWIGLLLTALLVPPLIARIRAEERLLRAQFGDEYGAYCARTSRLIPGIY